MDHYTELLTVLKDFSFRNVDEGLRSYLKNYSDRHMIRNVKLTHKELADELGTTRVVKS